MIFWTICLAEERYNLQKRTVLWLVQNLELYIEVLWKKLEILHTNTYVSLIQYLSIDSWIWNKPMSIADNTHMQEMTQQNTLILPVPCQYMFPLTNFIVNSPNNFQTNPSVHSINLTRKYNPHRPHANLSCFQKSAFNAGIIVFNNFLLPLTSPTDKSTV